MEKEYFFWSTIMVLSLSGTAYGDFSPEKLQVFREDISHNEIVAVLNSRLDPAYRAQSKLLASHMIKLCRDYDFAPGFILAVIQAESDFNVTAVSKVGAIGLMQVMPETASFFSKKRKFSFYRKEKDLFDPFVNLHLGISYLDYLRDRFQFEDLYIAAYNLGPGNVSSVLQGGRAGLLDQVSDYVAKIKYGASLHRTYKIKNQAAAGAISRPL